MLVVFALVYLAQAVLRLLGGQYQKCSAKRAAMVVVNESPIEQPRHPGEGRGPEVPRSARDRKS